MRPSLAYEAASTSAGLPALVLGLCIAALAFRVTLGIDLGDEAYYAAFIDGWLKRGLGDNPFLMVHQTADLLVYPLALVYRAVLGSADGLVLFLRLVYVAISALSAACLYQAVLPYRGRAMATLAAAFSLLFVPFSLPAPSYNTLGMCSLVAALSLFAVGINRPLIEGARVAVGGLAPWLWLSAAWWAVACVAYPPLLAPWVVLILLGLVVLRSPNERSLVVRYAMVCGALLAVALLLLCFVLGPSHLLEMVRFTNAFNNVSGSGGSKLRTAMRAWGAHPQFALMCLAAVLLAGARCLQARVWRVPGDLALSLLIIGVATADAPTFFSRAHDLVLLLALSGWGIAVRALVAPEADRRHRVFALIYAVSFVGGLTTAATAFNGLFNFPIGGFLAGALALVLPRVATASSRILRLAVMMLACGTLAVTTFTHYYGQIGPLSYRDAVRVPRGAFAGLRTDPDQAAFILRMTEAIERQRSCGNKFAVLGTGPGFYLMTSMLPTALSTWNYPGDANNFAVDAVNAFYASTANRPDVLVVNNWQWATPLSAEDRALLDSYVQVDRIAIGLRDASVFRRGDCNLHG